MFSVPLSGFLATFIILASFPASSALGSARLGQEIRRCTNILPRHEWRNLTTNEKQEYISAVQCLQKMPAKSTFRAARSRYDDFQALHINMTDQVHTVGQFLPWHRLFVAEYERALREDCGYQGAAPYWDWTLDVTDFETLLRSPVFDPTTGFGGANLNGRAVTDGPFASYNLSFGPGATINNHRLTRSLNTTFLPYLSQAQVLNTTKQTTFKQFWIELEGRPLTPGSKLHDAGHRIIGGDMSDTYSSAGEPLFYLHHTNLDRIWWGWQMEDPKRRLYAISGRSTYEPPYKDVTLDWPLSMADVAPPARIRDVMDIAGGYLCYRYV